MRTQKRKHKITSKEVFLPTTKLPLSSFSTDCLNCQTCRIPQCSWNLTSRVSIPPWHKIHVLIISRPCHELLRAEPARWWRAAQSLHKRVRAYTLRRLSLFSLTSYVLCPSGQRRERTTAGRERHNRSGMGRRWVGTVSNTSGDT